IEPRSIVKEIRDLTNRVRLMQAEKEDDKVLDALATPAKLSKDQLRQMITDLEFQMKQAAKNLEFEKAAAFRDQVVELRQMIALKEDTLVEPSIAVVKQATRK
ncbi:MAG: UvrB/UvrC motif-containing protein, partial [Anaerolineae bacterium]|nr:UvrB/UvrC motif-containing protein [Anaerolineae bacterium]